MAIQIQGTVQYQSLGTGFWGIIGKDGQKWRPVNMPEQLKTNGAKVTVKAKAVEDAVSIFMWGTPVRIQSFQTLMPW